MKPKLILCLALALSGGLFGCSSSQTLHNGAITKTSLKKNGVTVEISLPDAVSAGQPVEMVVNVTNAAPQSVFFMTWIRALGIWLRGNFFLRREVAGIGHIFSCTQQTPLGIQD